MNTKITAISIVVFGFLVAGAIIVSNNSSGTNPRLALPANLQQNVVMLGDKQAISIYAKGGYLPRVSNAKAGVASVLKISTSGTFDCSSIINIPSLGYRTNLPPTGETSVELPPQKAGTSLVGLCGMGMYNFTINFN